MQVASRPSGASLLLLWVSSLVSRREQATDDTVLRRKQLGLWAQTEVYSVHKFVGHFFLLLFFCLCRTLTCAPFANARVRLP